MMERIYDAMKKVGRQNVILGILIIVGGVLAIVSGSFIVAGGGSLLKKKSEILF